MPGALAYKPGDVITTLSGKTVEVLNTDAEGRIVLADALWYARRYQPEAMIDIATLTGAIDIALGPHAIGLMGTDSALLARIVEAGEASKERVWQLPLWDEYRQMIKSNVADIRNTGGGRQGGAITAAAFLDAFVDDIPWAHLDIAATVGNDHPSRPDNTPGATGVGVRLLAQLLLSWDDAIDKHS
jgi:leucyl aminopeptidase